ncbi:metallopeptidase [archaeon]|jgi:predicted metallopeptidase|nr:metallopeptidase [archaeon]
MRYEYAFDLQQVAEDVSIRMFPHVKVDRIKCLRSYGSSTRGTIARCHALGKVMQLAMAVDAFYALEFLTEKFNKLSEEEKVKVVIHELMHIPESFGGGFKHHDVVTDRNVNRCYDLYLKLKENEEKTDWFKLQKKKN